MGASGADCLAANTLILRVVPFSPQEGHFGVFLLDMDRASSSNSCSQDGQTYS